MCIGSRIERLRLLSGKSQEALGIDCGYPKKSARSTINQFEKGKKIPSESDLKSLASALKVPIESLLLYNDDLLHSYNGLYQVLFELEEAYGLHPEIIDNRLCLTFGPEIDGLDSGLRSWKNEMFLKLWYTIRNRVLRSKNDIHRNYANDLIRYDRWKTGFSDETLQAAVAAIMRQGTVSKVDDLLLSTDDGEDEDFCVDADFGDDCFQ